MQTLRISGVVSKVGMSRGWIYAQMKVGKFPKPVALGARARGWVEGDIDLWIESRRQPAAEAEA